MKYTKKDFTIGQTVVLELTGNAARHRTGEELIIDKVVKAIGNKYVTVGWEDEDYGDVKIRFEDGRESTNYSSNYTLYLTRKELEDRMEKDRIYSKLRNHYFGDYNETDKLNLDKLRRILVICEEEQLC